MKPKITIIGIISIVLFVLIFSIVPWLKMDGRGYVCRLCGAEKTTGKIYILSVRVWSTSSRIHENDLTKIYNENIGMQHKHQWAVSGSGRSYYTLLGRSLFTHGGPSYQKYLTKTALHAVDQVGNWPKGQKIVLFNNILNCTKPNEYQELQIIFKSTKNVDPNQIWIDWLMKQKGKNIQPLLSE